MLHSDIISDQSLQEEKVCKAYIVLVKIEKAVRTLSLEGTHTGEETSGAVGFLTL